VLYHAKNNKKTHRNLDESPREAALVRDAHLVKKAAPAEPPPPHAVRR
jgi:hypothetical protein